MRIALFTDTYKPQINGVARTLERLVDHASDRGHEVALVAPSAGPQAPGRNALEIRIAGFALPFYRELKLARMLSADEGRRLAAFAPDVVHVATEFTIGWSGLLWSQQRAVPVVSSFHTNFAAYVGAYGWPALERTTWNFLRAFHERALLTYCPSESTRQDLLHHGFNQDVRIWSRGVCAESFSPGRRSLELRKRLAPDADCIFLYVGRLAPEKRVEVILDAFQPLRREFGGRVAMVLAGEGPIANVLKSRTDEGVEYAGYVTGNALAELYASCDVFAFPSDTETFGNVVLEAAASGLPAVVADRGGVLETVKHQETGIVCAAGDRDAFSSAMRAFIVNSALRTACGERARRHAERQSWSTILDGVLSGYATAASMQAGRKALQA